MERRNGKEGCVLCDRVCWRPSHSVLSSSWCVTGLSLPWSLQLGVILWLVYLKWNDWKYSVSTFRPNFSEPHLLFLLVFRMTGNEDDINALKKQLFILDPRVISGWNSTYLWNLVNNFIFIFINLWLSSVENLNSKPQ